MQIRPYSSLLWLRPFVALLRNGAMQGRRSSHVFPGRCGARARPPQWMSCRPRYGKGISANESRSQCPPLVCLKSCLNLAWKEALARVNLAPTKAPGAGRWPLAATLLLITVGSTISPAPNEFLLLFSTRWIQCSGLFRSGTRATF